MKAKSHPNTQKNMTEKHNAKYIERHHQKSFSKVCQKVQFGKTFLDQKYHCTPKALIRSNLGFP